MSFQRAVLLAFALLLAVSSTASAGLPHWRRRREVPYPTTTYAPQMRHYTVIDPTVVGTPPKRKHAFLKETSPPGQIVWRQQVQAVPTYPWGWFGARSHIQNLEHKRFYGNERDWGYFRGD
ncbi:MAG: hypothetical protein ACREHD_02045 [Pirellulales bacterium]